MKDRIIKFEDRELSALKWYADREYTTVSCLLKRMRDEFLKPINSKFEVFLSEEKGKKEAALKKDQTNSEQGLSIFEMEGEK